MEDKVVKMLVLREVGKLVQVEGWKDVKATIVRRHKILVGVDWEFLGLQDLYNRGEVEAGYYRKCQKDLESLGVPVDPDLWMWVVDYITEELGES